MKKILSFLLAITFSASLLVGCSKSPEKALPRKDGKWNYTQTVTMSGGSILQTETGSGVFTSTTLVITDSKGATSNETWSYDKTSKKITVTESGTPFTFTVSDETRSAETWTYSDATVGYTMVLKWVKA
jgi:hypothetical protein